MDFSCTITNSRRIRYNQSNKRDEMNSQIADVASHCLELCNTFILVFLNFSRARRKGGELEEKSEDRFLRDTTDGEGLTCFIKLSWTVSSSLQLHNPKRYIISSTRVNFSRRNLYSGVLIPFLLIFISFGLISELPISNCYQNEETSLHRMGYRKARNANEKERRILLYAIQKQGKKNGRSL